ncbi:hypothetical protein SAMN05443661_12120 [Natronobacterium gregoryi]|uniref:Uncharacterized protein n=2 Tax=Natronobacterium gregoryi TaxID=44930 RepID=L0AN49_NATGS|nr:hypothetical protein Natgr_3483 [Natronobacterium gregoryi SP2]SFJ30275.1 hypothetical protein SAMN05443661_12120 [Natronobacterium gregoryi]
MPEDGTERVRLCPTCDSESVDHCPEDPKGKKRCGECGARFHGAKVRYVHTGTGRGQADPRVVGLLVLVVGIVLTIGMAAGVIIP